MFIGLHRHSHYSKRDGIAKIPDIVNRVGELGQTAWALTDHGTTSGLMEAYKETQKYNKAHGTNIKFIFGCEVYWVPNYYVQDRKASCHLLLLAKSETGYKNLLKLVTIGYGDKGKSPDHYYYTMRLTTEEILKHKEGLIVTSACMGGILNPMTDDGWDEDLAYERARYFKENFGNDFYLEIQTPSDPLQIEYNKRIVEMSAKLDISVIVTEDSHYVRKDEASIHRSWLGLDSDSDYYSTDDYYIHSESEVLDAISYLPKPQEYIDNTSRIADKCETVNIKFGGKNFPELPIDEPVLDRVCRIVAAGWKKKIEGVVPEEKHDIYKKQIAHELKVLEKCDYLTYFLMNEDFITWARNNGIRTGIGRGSVGGSLIAYLMDLTRIDPIKYGLIFERFAHDKRVSLPDVDSDLPNTRRQDVIEYLVNKYGEAFHVRTFGTMAEKAAIQRAAKSSGYNPEQVRQLSKTCKSISNIPDKAVRELANAYVGIIQNFGVHASALMLFPAEATNWCAIEKQGDKYVCAYEYPDLEKQGLLKLDLLGIKTLDAIQNTLDMLDNDVVKNIEMENLPDDDKITFDMLCKGDVMGCFQIESEGMVGLLRSIKPRNIFDLVPLVALYRPSTLQSGMVDSFVRRREGEPFEYLHEKLVGSLKDTYGVLLYQEQAMKIVQDMAGYDLGQADMFRRAIGHKVPEEMAILIPQFVKDGSKLGIDADTMNKLAEWLTNCASYQFNKSHSAAYGYTAYQTAYLKAHFPAEYTCGYLNAYKDDAQDKLLPYIEDARKHNIKILPPDGKHLEWTVENLPDGRKGLRVGLSYIRSVGTIPVPVTAESFRKLTKNKAENLIKAGAVDFLGDRKTLLKDLFSAADIEKLKKQKELTIKRIEQNEEKKNTAKPGSKKQAEAEQKILKYSSQKWDIDQRIEELENIVVDFDKEKAEIEVLGFSFRDPFDGYDVSKFSEPQEGKHTITLGMVTQFKEWKQKNGKPMAFLTIRCPSGNLHKLVMFNFCYQPLELNKVYRLSLEGEKVRRVL